MKIKTTLSYVFLEVERLRSEVEDMERLRNEMERLEAVDAENEQLRKMLGAKAE